MRYLQNGDYENGFIAFAQLIISEDLHPAELIPLLALLVKCLSYRCWSDGNLGGNAGNNKRRSGGSVGRNKNSVNENKNSVNENNAESCTERTERYVSRLKLFMEIVFEGKNVFQIKSPLQIVSWLAKKSAAAFSPA